MSIDELLTLDISTIPKELIAYNDNLIAHEKKFNMYIKEGSPFIHHLYRKDVYVGYTGWVLNIENGFVYKRSDKSKSPHLSFYNNKFWKWNMKYFNKNKEKFYITEKTVERYF
jgi:hypothetical protein